MNFKKYNFLIILILLTLLIIPNINADWQETQPIGDNNGYWYTSAMSDDGNIILVGDNYQRLYLTTNSGTSWIETQPDGNVNKRWQSSAMSSDGNIIIAGISNGRLYLTTNGGTSWTETQPAGAVNKYWYSTAMSSDGNTIIASAYNSRLYLTTDGGDNWAETQPAGAVDKLWQTSAMSNDGNIIIVAVYAGKTYLTINGGTSWTETQPAGNVSKYWYNTAMSSDGNTIIISMKTGRIYLTTNGGTSWTETQPAGDVDKSWYNTAMSSDGNIIIANAYNSRLYLTTDGGTSWTETQPAGDVNKPWQTSAMSSDGNIIITGAFDDKLYLYDSKYTLPILINPTPTGTYYNNFDLNLTTNMSDANIYYTDDNSTPNNTDILYSTPFTINSTQTIKATAYDGTDYTDVVEAIYTMEVGGLPTADINTGTYYNNFNITLTKDTNTTTSTLRYTTNGDNPTIASTLYTTPISITETTTFKFAQFQTGYTPTAITTKTYTMEVTNPIITETTETYNNSFTTTITDATTTASIYYTIDGSVPDNTDTLYTGAITINATQTLKAIAYQTGYTTSGVDTETYTMEVTNPIITETTGTYNNSFTTTITDATTTASIYYTIDGSVPDNTDTLYTGAITINATQTLKAIAYKSGYTTSGIDSETYTLITATPIITETTGTYYNNFITTITDEVIGSLIRYTTTGIDPINTDTVYTIPLTISSTTILKAKAWADGMSTSIVATETYTMQVGGLPTADVNTDTFNNNFNVTLTKDTNTTTSTLTYTTNGVDPTIASTEYTAPISITGTTTLKFAQFQTGYTPTAITTKIYTMVVTDPVITETTGTYNNSFTTTITNPTTTGTSIYYTIDGSVPDNTDTLYTGAITINATQTLKAIAYKSGYTTSGVDTEVYTMQVAGTPTSNVNTGSYSVPQNVTLTKAGTTTGTTMTYTTNGNAPTIASTEYTTPILINSTTTLKFAEFKTGYTAGTIVTKTITITITDPYANINTGTAYNDFAVILSQVDSQNVYYTTDGTNPDNTDTIFSSAINITATTTLKFIAYNGAIYSNIITKTYTMEVYPILAVADYNTNTYYNNFNVTLTKNLFTTDSILTYTTDSSNPTITSTEYTTPISIIGTTTLKFAQFKTGYTPTTITTKTYTMVVTNPIITETTETYNNSFTTTITDATTTASIYYTIDGSVPDNTDTLYTGAISIGATQTLKAKAFQTGYTASAVDTEIYTMEVAGTPTANIPTGNYTVPQTVILTKVGTTTGTTLTYTTGGGNPTIASTEYTVPLHIGSTTTLKFAEFKTGYTAGTIATKTYTITVTDPTANYNTDTYNNDFSVTLSQVDLQTIYYTTDGTNPDNTDTLYSAPISITGTTTLKFIAYNSTIYSNIITKTYTMVVLDPVITVTTNTFNNDFTTTITSGGTISDKIYYTTDGTNPDNIDTLYTGAILIGATQTLKSIAYKTGYTTSGIDTETYTMQVGGLPTVDKVTDTYYNYLLVTLTKDTNTTGSTLTYTTDGNNPTIASTEYTFPISILNTTTLKFAQFKTGYTATAITTRTYTIHVTSLNIQFYDENTLALLDENVTITDITNSVTYNPDVNGLWTIDFRDIDWNGNFINATINRTVAGTTTHTSRNLQFYWDNQADHDLNFSLLPVELGEEVEFLAKDTNGNFWTNKFVQFETDGNILSSNLTDASGKFTSYILTTGDYNAVLYDATATEGDNYIKTTVTVLKPENEKSLVDISPYDIEVGGLLLYSVSNTTDANHTINIFGGTTSTYDFTLVDYNADSVDRIYIPRTYNIKNPWGLTYDPAYTLQGYLITKEEGVIPSIVVYDELKRPYPDITVSIFKQIEGNLKLVEQKVTDSTGRTSFSGYPLDTYYIYLYENGTLRGSYTIQVRDTGEIFYFVLDRTATNEIVYRGLDLKYDWNTTPDYIQLSTQDLDVNLNVYGYYLNDFNITGYTINTYQNNALIETATDVLTGTNVTITETFNKSNYTVAKPIVVVANVTFTYNGEIRTLQIKKSVATGTSESGLLMVLKNFPEKVGYIWTILLSILITISVIVLVGTSGFIDRNYLLYLGLFVLGIFVFIGWFAVGVEVLGIDVMWFMYIITIVAAVGFAVKDEQR